MPLTDTIKNAKLQAKPCKLADEKGLFLLVQPNGSRYWRWKFRFGGREKLLALGVYPDVSLKAGMPGHEAGRDDGLELRSSFSDAMVGAARRPLRMVTVAEELLLIQAADASVRFEICRLAPHAAPKNKSIA